MNRGADKTLREKTDFRYHCPRAAPYVCDYFDQRRPVGKRSRTVRVIIPFIPHEYYCEVMDEKDKIIAFMNDTFVRSDRTEG